MNETASCQCCNWWPLTKATTRTAQTRSCRKCRKQNSWFHKSSGSSVRLLLIITVFSSVCHAGKPPRIRSNQLTYITARVGESCTLPCEVKPGLQKSNPHSLWTKNGVIINDAWKGYSVHKLELRIKSLSLEDGGLFMCTVINGFGSTNVQVQLSVEDDADANSPDTDLRLKKPIFSEPTKMRQVTVVKPHGSTIKFHCKARGRPKPKIQWYKDGNLTGSRHRRPQWTLTLKKVAPEASGTYTCRVWNSEGEAMFSYTLRVIVFIGERLMAPVLLPPHPVNTTVYEGDKASLQCRVRSAVEPIIKWVKEVDPKTLTKTDKDVVYVKGHKSAFLVLPKQPMMMQSDGSYLSKYVVQNTQYYRDAGIYVCLAINPEGQYRWRYAMLTVHPVSGYSTRHTGPSYYPPDHKRNNFSLLLVIAIPASLAFIFVLCFSIYCLCRKDHLKRRGTAGSKSSRTPLRADGSSASTVPPSLSSSPTNRQSPSTGNTSQEQQQQQQQQQQQTLQTSRDELTPPHHHLHSSKRHREHRHSVKEDQLRSPTPIYGVFYDHLNPPMLPEYESSIGAGAAAPCPTAYETEASDGYVTSHPYHPPPPPPSPPSRYSRSSTALTDVTSSTRSLNHHHHHHHHRHHKRRHHHRCPEHHRCYYHGNSYTSSRVTVYHERYLTGASSTEPSLTGRNNTAVESETLSS